MLEVYESMPGLDVDARCGRLSTTKTAVSIQCIREMVWMTVQLMVNELGMSQDSIWMMLTNDLETQEAYA